MYKLSRLYLWIRFVRCHNGSSYVICRNSRFLICASFYKLSCLSLFNKFQLLYGTAQLLGLNNYFIGTAAYLISSGTVCNLEATSIRKNDTILSHARDVVIYFQHLLLTLLVLQNCESKVVPTGAKGPNTLRYNVDSYVHDRIWRYVIQSVQVVQTPDSFQINRTPYRFFVDL